MSVETQNINYPCFNLTTAICENAGQGFDLKSVAATISIVVFPIIVAIASLEAIFDLLAILPVAVLNYLTPALAKAEETSQAREVLDPSAVVAYVIDGKLHQLREGEGVPTGVMTFSKEEAEHVFSV